MTGRQFAISALATRHLKSEFVHCSQIYLTPTQNTGGTEGKIALKARPRHAEAAGRVIIWRNLEQIFFKLFRPRARLANVIDTVCQNCGHHNYNYSCDVSASYRLVPGKLPGRRAP
jgi:hypothetical protein